MSDSYLRGAVAVVTGGGGGLGAACAQRLAAAGARVVVQDLGVALDGSGDADPNPAGVVAARIVADGGDAVAEHGDLADYDGVGDMVARTLERWGRLDVVVNAAGVLRDRMLFNMTPEEWDLVTRVHLRGLFAISRHAAAHWRAAPEPTVPRRLIAFTSRSGLNGAATQPNYSAAKLGAVGFVFSCAKSLAKYGVTSVALCPTAATRMTATVPGDRAAVVEGSPASSPDNVAEVVTYLAGPDSGWCNGQIIGSNGYEVSLYSRPVIARSITKDEPWGVAELGGRMESEFRDLALAQANIGVPAKGST